MSEASNTTSSLSEKESGVDDELVIQGARIPVRICHIEHKKLHFYPENPRIFSVIGAGEKTPAQHEIENRLLDMDHVKSLIQDIERNDGLIDPIIVKDGALQVLEGNSRLAAYRALSKVDPIKWGYIKCKLLPEDIGEDRIFALLGQYHVKGRKDWQPYEQAGFLYRRHKNQGIDISTLAKEIGIGTGTVRQLIDTYQFMIDHNQTSLTRWSYFYEYLKSKRTRGARDEYEDFDQLIVEKVNSGEIAKATDVRDKLPIIVTTTPKVLKKFARGDIEFDEAYDRAVDAGGDSTGLKKISSFRRWLGQKDVQDKMLRLDGQAGKKVRFEFRHLTTLVRKISGKLNPDS